MNLYSEIKRILEVHDKDFYDIWWVECSDENGKTGRHLVDIDNFISAAKNTDWDEDGWFHEINEHLMIYGKGRSFLISVREYDGQCSLEYTDMEKTMPKDVMKFETFHTKAEDGGLLSKLMKKSESDR